MLPVPNPRRLPFALCPVPNTSPATLRPVPNAAPPAPPTLPPNARTPSSDASVSLNHARPCIPTPPLCSIRCPWTPPCIPNLCSALHPQPLLRPASPTPPPCSFCWPWTPPCIPNLCSAPDPQRRAARLSPATRGGGGCCIRSDATCIICREEMTTSKKLFCGHLFHVHCLRSWLERQHTCPTCRAPLSPSDNGRPASARQHGAQPGVQLAAGAGTPGSERAQSENVNKRQAKHEATAAAASLYGRSFAYPPTNTLNRYSGPHATSSTSQSGEASTSNQSRMTKCCRGRTLGIPQYLNLLFRTVLLAQQQATETLKNHYRWPMKTL